MSIDCTFTGHPLDRADARRNDASWLQTQRGAPESRFLAYSELRPALLTEMPLRAMWAEPDALPLAPDAEPVFLGLTGEGHARFAVDVGDMTAPPGSKFIDVRSAAIQIALTGDADPEVALIGLGRSLLAWNASHRFCSSCGKPTRSSKGGFGRACMASDCAADHFARVDPVVIMLVVDPDGDRCVLGRQPRFPALVFSALAGFVEPGESLEEAVRREVYEESNLRVSSVRYVASQPWPFPSSLMLGCIARAETFDLQPDPAELEDARWFSRAELISALQGRNPEVRLPPPIAIAHRLIRAWTEGLLKS